MVARRARCWSVPALLAVSAAAAMAVTAVAFPSLAAAATISGNVKEAAAPQSPLEGVRVCANQLNFQLDGLCTTTDAFGNYSLSLGQGQYSVHFDDSERNRNVVSQYYGGNPVPLGTPVTVASVGEAVTGIDAQLQPGSTIEGTVTDAITHGGIAGTPVCAEIQTPTGPYGRCVRSGAEGIYRINGLAPGDYPVEFQTGELNYQRQSYGERVEILGPGETVSGIDAAMKPGFEISGRLTEAGTGFPVERINVDLQWVGSEESAEALTNGSGEYVFRGLPEADYVLLFSRPLGPAGADIDCLTPQYYKGSSTLAGATVLHGVPGTAISGIDAELVNFCPKPPPPLQVTLAPPTPLGNTAKPPHCHKGFHRKRVKGHSRCVRKRHHHHNHHRHRKHPHG